MGASFLFSFVPEVHLTDARMEEIKSLLAEIPDERFKDFVDGIWVDDEFDAQATREAILAAVKQSQGTNKTTCRALFYGLDYYLHISGGLSWGDPPTDAYDTFQTIGRCPPVYDAMLRMSREDFKKGNA